MFNIAPVMHDVEYSTWFEPPKFRPHPSSGPDSCAADVRSFFARTSGLNVSQSNGSESTNSLPDVKLRSYFDLCRKIRYNVCPNPLMIPAPKGRSKKFTNRVTSCRGHWSRDPGVIGTTSSRARDETETYSPGTSDLSRCNSL